MTGISTPAAGTVPVGVTLRRKAETNPDHRNNLYFLDYLPNTVRLHQKMLRPCERDVKMNATNQRLCTWCGLLFQGMFLVGFVVIARYLPPMQPSATAAQIAHTYRDNSYSIRIGMVVGMFGLAFWVPFIAAVSVQLKRIEGEHTPCTYAQLAIGAGLPVAFLPVLYYFEVAAFRSERADESIQMLNDMGWLPFTGIVYGIFVQNLVIALAVFSDRRATPIYPRWYAYFCLWIGTLYLPASLDVLFKDGPLAWNGVFSLYLSLAAFCAWLVVTMVMTLHAITAQEAASGEEGALAVGMPGASGLLKSDQ